jgi:hypothetical protein
MNTEQIKLGVKILEILIQNSNMNFNIEKLFSWMKERPFDGLTWLESNGFIYEMTGSFYPTDAGAEYYKGACKNSGFEGLSTQGFKDEALSGISTKKSSKSGFQVSKKSEIKNAALLSNKRTVSYKRPDAAMISEEKKIEIKHKIIADTGLEAEDIKKNLDRIKRCPCCGKYAVFGRNKAHNDGLQTYCKRCTREKRSKRNDK